MQTFNYVRGHREVVAPLYEKLPDEMRKAFDIACKYYEFIEKHAILFDLARERLEASEFEEVESDLKFVEDLLLTADLEMLGEASEIIYYYGHWAYIEGINVTFGGHPPRLFVKDEFDAFSPLRESKDYINYMKEMYPNHDDTTVLVDTAYRGPNNKQTGGAYWRLSGLIKQYIISRTSHERPGFRTYYGRDVARRLGIIATEFQDHVPGTDFDLEELPDLFNLLLPDHITCDAITSVNYKPHPPVIGTKAMEAASTTGTLGGECPCDHEGCLLTIAEHTSDLAMVLSFSRDVDEQEFLDAIQQEGFMKLYGKYDIKHLGFASSSAGQIIVATEEEEKKDETQEEED